MEEVSKKGEFRWKRLLCTQQTHDLTVLLLRSSLEKKVSATSKKMLMKTMKLEMK
jgi:hypothetical protein